MCIRDSVVGARSGRGHHGAGDPRKDPSDGRRRFLGEDVESGRRLLRAVSYTHLRAHENVLGLVCRLLLEKKNHDNSITQVHSISPNVLRKHTDQIHVRWAYHMTAERPTTIADE